MERRQIANIIFFIRAVEPREPELDLAGTVRRQLELVRQYRFPATFLLQYDALIRPDYIDMLKENLPDGCEVGGWFEIVQPLVEKAGLIWRGREGFSWDWHADVGFSVGYSPQERRMLADIYMDEFCNRFGDYPRSVGSWVIDAGTLAYMAEKYGVTASCNCRDQWGTDGYTLWGGYYGQGYYPSRRNMLCPAQTAENQIPVPIFRMLGSDPIYQYDLGLLDGDEMKPSEDQSVVTLEPIYTGCGGGGDPVWVDWYFKENFRPGLTFGYAQIGQENSFGWQKMENGLRYQFDALRKLQRTGGVCVETLGETGKWFRRTFPLTPASSISGLSDWQGKGRKSLWYDSRFYRANFYEDAGRFWIRDIHKFDEQYAERYLEQICRTHSMTYDNLPVIDGNRWSAGKIRAGLYPLVQEDNGQLVPLTGELSVHYPDDENAEICFGNDERRLRISCSPTCLRFSLEAPVGMRLVLEMRDGAGALNQSSIGRERLFYQHNGYAYDVRVSGAMRMDSFENGVRMTAEDAGISMLLHG